MRGVHAFMRSPVFEMALAHEKESRRLDDVELGQWGPFFSIFDTCRDKLTGEGGRRNPAKRVGNMSGRLPWYRQGL